MFALNLSIAILNPVQKSREGQKNIRDPWFTPGIFHLG